MRARALKKYQTIRLKRGSSLASTSFLNYLPEDSLVKIDAQFKRSRAGQPEAFVIVDNPDDIKEELDFLFTFFRIEINKLDLPVTFRSTATIAEIAESNPDFSTLEAALKLAGLFDVVDSEGTFTVFAPTDAAFQALGSDTLSFLTSPEGKETLTNVLLYHVIAGQELKATGVLERATLPTALGLPLSVDAGVPAINSSNLVVTDILTANGVIHVIDAVLLPDDAPVATGNIAEVASEAGIFSTLLAAVGQTGLAGALTDSDNPVTVFAPTDAAFAALPEGLLGSLSEQQLRNILLYHVVAGRVDSATLFGLDSAPSLLLGQSIRVNGELERINASDFVLLDIPTTTGNVHVIDRVLIPSTF